MAGLDTLAQIPKITDVNFWAQGQKQLGPCFVYAGDFGIAPDPVAMTGTVTAAGVKTLTGTGTAFLTEISPGQFIKIDGVGTFRVDSVASDTSLDLFEAVTATADTIERVHLRFLGRTDATKVTLAINKTDLVCSQDGAVRADKVVTGYAASIEFGIADGDPDDIAFVTQGLTNEYEAADGTLKSTFFGFPIGELDSTIAHRLYLQRIVAGVASAEPNDCITFLKVAPMVDTEFTRDRSCPLAA